MKILLVYPDILPSVKKFRGYMHLGISSIAACLIKAGHEVRLLHLINEPSRNKILDMAKRFQPGLIGISATTNQFATARFVAATLREVTPEAKIIVGGIHVILNTDQVIECPEFDLACRGEGELPLLHLAEKLEKGQDWRDTPSTWVKLPDGSIQRNPMLPVITDLDSLPYANRDIWDYPSLQMESNGAATVMFSRGCPRKCTYCCNHAISRIYLEGGDNRYFRQRSVDSAITELLWIKGKYPFIKSFNFDDDNLFLNLTWAKQFAERYAKEVRMPFACNIFPSQVDGVRVGLLKLAGCTDLRIGLESGNEGIRSQVLGRQTSDAEISRGYRLCREAGIRTRSFVMIGLPFETPEMVLDSIKVIADERVGIAQHSIFYPYRKTILYERCVEHGFLEEGAVAGSSDYFSRSMLNIDTMSGGQIRMFRNFFPVFVMGYRLINRLPGTTCKIGRKILDYLLTRGWLPYVLNPFGGVLPFIRNLIPRALKTAIKGRVAPAASPSS